MAANFDKPGYILENCGNKSRLYNRLPLVFLILSLAAAGCLSNSNPSKQIPFKNSDIVFSNWDEIFEDDVVIPFTFNDTNMEIYSIGEMFISPDGDYFIIDGKAAKIIQFDAGGKFIRFIGGKGEGPGEYSIAGRPFMDSHKNLYIYDFPRYRINKYTYPNYDFEKLFKMRTGIQDIKFDGEGNFIIYTISDHYVLHKIKKNGEILKKTFQPLQIKFRLFSARFQLGKFSDIPGEGFLFSYPEEYKVYFSDDQLNIQKILYAKSNSRFFPGKAEFPGTLSPYDFTPGHAKWWSKSLRPGKVLYLVNGFFVQELVQYINMSEKYYMNLHDPDGFTYAAGVEIPFDGIILYAKGRHVYVLEDSRFDSNGKVIPLKLHRFRLKNNLKK